MAKFDRLENVIVDLTDRGRGTTKAEVKAVLGSNDLHDYRVGFAEPDGYRRVDVMESQLNKINHNQDE